MFFELILPFGVWIADIISLKYDCSKNLKQNSKMCVLSFKNFVLLLSNIVGLWMNCFYFAQIYKLGKKTEIRYPNFKFSKRFP